MKKRVKKVSKKLRRKVKRRNPQSLTYTTFADEYKQLMLSLSNLNKLISDQNFTVIFDAWKKVADGPNVGKMNLEKLRKTTQILESIRRSTDAAGSKIAQFNSSLTHFAPYSTYGSI